MSTRRIAIYVEVTRSRPSPPRSAGPAGCRASRDDGAALEALTSYAEQYAPVVEPAGVSFPSTVASMSSSGCLAGPRPRSPHPNAAGQIAWHVVEHGWEMQDPGEAVD